MKYLSIDIETTGLDPTYCNIIELAAVLEDTSLAPNLSPVENLSYFQSYFKHGILCGDHYAILEMNSELIKTTQEIGNTPPFVWEQFEKWLKGLGITIKDKVTVAGKNVAGFDLQFFPKHIKEYFYHRCLDPGSVFVNWSKDRLPSLQALQPDKPVAHNALEDARDVVRVLRKHYKT